MLPDEDSPSATFGVVRDIDFSALRSLRGRHGMAYPRGRVIVREGDTTSEFYVVLQGAVEFSIEDEVVGSIVVGRAGPGDFFGEIACFGAVPRAATATTVEDDTVLLFFNSETAAELLRVSPRFALGVIQRIGDRVREVDRLLRLANEKIARLEARSPPARPVPKTGAAAAAAASAARRPGRMPKA